MTTSILFNLIEKRYMNSWIEEVKKDKLEFLEKTEKTAKDELLQLLPENSKNLLDDFIFALKENLYYHNYKIDIKLLNLGVKIGFELQKSFQEYEED